MNETVVQIVAAWCGPRHEARTQTNREKCPDPRRTQSTQWALTAADGVCCGARNETCPQRNMSVGSCLYPDRRERLVVRIGLLGGVSAESDDGVPLDIGPAKCQAVLAVLALSAGSAVPVSRLVDLVWGDEPPRTAEKTLQS